MKNTACLKNNFYLMFFKILINTIYFLQVIFFALFSLLLLFFPIKRSNESVLIGRETCNLINNYSYHLGYKSIVMSLNRSNVNQNYWIDLSPLPKFLIYLLLPFFFAYCIRKFSRFVYFGNAAFFIQKFDGRLIEFRLLKLLKKKITTIFLGSEIRSISLGKDLADKNNFMHFVKLFQDSKSMELEVKKLCYSADMHADTIFNNENDQISYFKNPVFQPPYILTTNTFSINQSKWTHYEKLNIFHAPSSPLIKGTQLVSAAIEQLKNEKYDFNYIQVENMPHSQVLDILKTSHICLNEFYAYITGIFGLEALEANCVLLTSANKFLEPSLFEGADDAWISTHYLDIYKNLRHLLDNKHLLLDQANKGTLWCKKFYHPNTMRDYIHKQSMTKI